MDGDAAARAEYLPEEEEGEVEERATFRSRPGQRLHGPVAAVLTLSDLRPTLSSTMNLTTHAPLSLFALRFTTLVRVTSSNHLLRPLPQTKSSSTALSTMFVPPPGLCLYAQPRARVRPRLSRTARLYSPYLASAAGLDVGVFTVQQHPHPMAIYKRAPRRLSRDELARARAWS